jgi:methyl-accepting chemotaxis protein
MLLQWLNVVRRFTIRQRLMGMFVVTALALLLLGTVGVVGQWHARGVTSQLVSQDANALNEVTLMRLAMVELRAHEKDMVVFCESPGESGKAYQAWRGAHARAQRHLRSVAQWIRGDAERQALQQTEQSLAALETAFRPIAKKLVDEVGFMAPFYAAMGMAPLEAPFKRLDEASNALSSQLQANFDAGVGRVENASRMVLVLVGGATLLALCLIGVLTIANIRLICQPLNEAMAVAQRISQGDLSHGIRVQGSDEVAELSKALQYMQGALRQLVSHVREAANSILQASTEVAASNQDLSHRTEQTASNLQAAASSIQQLTDGIRHSTDSARQANQLAQDAAQVAATGGEVVTQVVRTMDNIHHSSSKISEITGVIDSIAFQTNILALNAAVEAARAGEQGRGFAVVAAEVRNLASHSAEAAKQIKLLIGESVDRAAEGSDLVQRAGQTMSSIVDSTHRVSNIVDHMAQDADQQAQEIERVNLSVVRLDAMTQQNAALVEQGAAAAESLKDQAERLNGLVDQFQLQSEDGDSLPFDDEDDPVMAP